MRASSSSKSSSSPRTYSRPSGVLRTTVSSLASAKSSARYGEIVVSSIVFKDVLLSSNKQPIMFFPANRLNANDNQIFFDIIEDTILPDSQRPLPKIIWAQHFSMLGWRDWLVEQLLFIRL